MAGNGFLLNICTKLNDSNSNQWQCKNAATTQSRQRWQQG